MSETFVAAIRRVSLETVAEMHVVFRINAPCFWPKSNLQPQFSKRLQYKIL